MFSKSGGWRNADNFGCEVWGRFLRGAETLENLQKAENLREKFDEEFAEEFAAGFQKFARQQ